LLRSLRKFGRIELPAATSWVGVGEEQMEEDCRGGQGITKDCGAKGRRRRRRFEDKVMRRILGPYRDEVQERSRRESN
jgi:hypothetical protein